MSKFRDLTGQKFGKLTAIDDVGINKHGKHLWKCICECGKEVVVIGAHLSNGNTKSCGCSRLGKLLKEETGNKFGRLTVIKLIGSDDRGSGVWLCRCDCGNEVTVIGNKLRNGNTKSCGCLQKECVAETGKSMKKYNVYDLSGEYGIGYTFNAGLFYFDLEDYDKIKKYCWYVASDNYIESSYKEKTILFHRIIMDCPDNMVVDHIYGKETRNDNRKYNLRICTFQHNTWNANVKGIDFSKLMGKWRARIRKDGITIHLGYFHKKSDAINVRRKAELNHFGEFAYKKERSY